MALCFAVGQLIIRSISYLEHPATSLAYQIIVGLVSMTVALPFVWVMPASAFDVGIFVLSGLLGAGGHYCMIRAFERTAARVVAPFTYVELIWAMVIGFAVFGDIPDPLMVLGAAIVAGSGLYILYRERA
jgi:drug/metabolite transporter (DMT)-like permease